MQGEVSSKQVKEFLKRFESLQKAEGEKDLEEVFDKLLKTIEEGRYEEAETMISKLKNTMKREPKNEFTLQVLICFKHFSGKEISRMADQWQNMNHEENFGLKGKEKIEAIYHQMSEFLRK